MSTILINGYFLSRPYTGFGDYTINLLKEFSQIKDKNFEFVIACPYKIDKKIIEKFESDMIHLIIQPYPKFLGKFLGKFYFEQIIIPKIARKNRCQLIHSFYPSISIFTNIKQIESIHDVIPWSLVEYQYSLPAKILRFFIKITSRKAQKIVTVSDWSKSEIKKHFNLPSEKIKVIYNGLNNEFKKENSVNQKNKILKKYQIEKPYIFYIGGFDARKKVGNMIVAFAKNKDKIKHNLILAGGVFSPQRKIYTDYYLLDQQLETLGIKNRVKRIGIVPYEDLPILHSEAELFLSPSIEEGFNIPLLDAMASRTPVIIHAGSASKEISDNSALEIDCENVEVFADSIKQVLDDKKLQKKIVEKQYQRQKLFRWYKSAEQMLDLYDKILHKDS
ncbi:MAG: Glycosyl transferase group 1 [Berkelbacteria bacterium GW2011_GWA2_35_9]|uniref:Glycosyl transferase group 1 n=1 Tax=Berkelbacteria bacterium GW2011_GWA2_35_9 TaxID=1618333 RepID=A0A0G0FMN8_9BACT|nr:MAG: Glycosyl transferase group 1 [Berkelbacteria bacterium GW2011_GWA2_35_9]